MTTAHQVRVLGVDDVDTLRGLLAMFARAFDDPASYTAHPPGDAYLRDLLASPTFVAIAACAGEAVIGGLCGYVLPKFEQARAEFYLYDLAVDEAWRRQGVATALIEETRRLARSRGIWVIFVQADLGDDPAIALYTRLGVREDVLHFDIDPGTEG
jgi:aminoglycoside 3-N-acetyltransferase I